MGLSPGQCRAARGFLDWTQDQLAEAAGVSRSTVRDFEAGRHALHRATETLLIESFEAAGVVLLPPDADGCGVKLRPDSKAAQPHQHRPARDPL